MEDFAGRFAAVPFGRGLSLGCGEGALERDIRKKNICREITGMDLSPSNLELARAKAEAEGLDGISYEVADFNALALPEAVYDIVFFHQALHHVRALEKCLDQVKRALKPGGLFYVDEYVGPSRDGWTEREMAAAREIYDRLPRKFKTRRRLISPFTPDDPSEAVRSAQIPREVGRRFTILERRDYGGNLFSIIYPHLRVARMTSLERNSLIADLIAKEKDLLQAGIPSYYAVLICLL
jgi:SAM-dependent methyltransferase